MQTPASLRDLQRFMASLDWEGMRDQIKQETQTRLAIIGPVNAGKSTLFNALEGWSASPTSAVPGTTQQLVANWFGPFVLVDTPGFGEVQGVDRAEIARQAIRLANVVVLVLDAAAGVRQSDYELYQQLVSSGKSPIVALNKMDLVRKDRGRVLADARRRLDGARIFPISARHGTGVATELMPAILESDPSIAIAIGRALPNYRRMAVGQVIRNAAMLNAIVGAEPIPGLAIPLLLAGHIRLVLRIAAIYGEMLNAERARELLAAMAGGLVWRYLAIAAVKFIPGPGWMIAAVVAWIGTVAVGQVAALYFESGKNLTPSQIRELYRHYVRRRSTMVDDPGTDSESVPSSQENHASSS